MTRPIRTPPSAGLRIATALCLAGVVLLARAAFAQTTGSDPMDGGSAVDRARASANGVRFPAEPPPLVSTRHGGGHQRDALHVLLARVIANESTRVLRPTHDGGGTAGELDADARAIWQVTLAWARWKGTTPETAIRRLAPHVTGTRAPKRARHALYATLPARGGERPALWVDAEHGPWAVYGRNWTRLRANVTALIAGAAPRPCAGEPIAWGGTMDESIAIRRGLVKLDCGAVANSFWSLPPSRTVSALDAGGRR